jgi:hypothetical protein
LPDGEEIPICLAFIEEGEPKLPGSKPGAAAVEPEPVLRVIHGQWP